MVNNMRTTIDIPDELMKKAMKVSGARNKTTTVCMGLKELIRMHQMQRLIDLEGKIDLDLDAKKLRMERDME